MEELAAPTFDVNTGKMVMGKDERVMYDEMLRGSLKAVDNMRMIPFIIMEIMEQQVELSATQNQESDDDDGNFEFDE